MTTERPDISVCIANYNGDDYVLACLASVYAQKGSLSVEVVLNDDCSTDDSLDKVRRHYPGVLILTSEENNGFCISNNRMVEAASGRYLLLLNNDAVLRPGSLQALYAFAEQGHSDAILGLPQYSLHDASLVDRGYEFDLFMNPIPVYETGSRRVSTVTGACLWINRASWDRIGGFPPWFESVAEDIYLCQAARLLGIPTYILAEPGFDHWIGSQLGGGKVVERKLRSSVRRRSLSERNKTFVMLLCYPAWALLVLFPVHALLLAIEASFMTITGPNRRNISRIYLPLPAALWQRRKEIGNLRKRLASLRTLSGLAFMRPLRWWPHKLRMLARHGRPMVQ